MNLGDFKTRLKKVQESPPKKGSQRGELIGMFLEKLNADRKPPFKPLTAARIGMMLAPIKSVSDLRAFYRECEYAPHFSKYFWYCYKSAKSPKITE